MSINMLNENTINNVNRTDDDNINDSVAVQEYAANLRPHSPNAEQTLVAYTPTTTPHLLQQQQNINILMNINPLNISSRVTIAVGKYPNDATLQDFGALQMWMYTHTNKRSPIDVCQSLMRIYLHRQDEYSLHTAFNVYLICAETYQASGHNHQASNQLHEAEIIANMLYNSTAMMNPQEMRERERKQTKAKDIKMKLKFQGDFQSHLHQDQEQRSSSEIFCLKNKLINQTISLDSRQDEFFQQLCIKNPTSEQCHVIWRQIVLQCMLNPKIAIIGAQWLLSYAHSLESHTIQHANSLYVAMNLFLFDSGADFFRKYPQIDLFQILDDIGRYFDEYGNQAKQFSPIHKMAHVWGTAAVAFHLKSDNLKYLVCACMMRVSFESLGICFRSSGVESLYILAQKYAPNFFLMMGYDPHVKLNYPPCINSFRQKLELTETCIRYSSDTVDRFASEFFNIDMTEYRV